MSFLLSDWRSISFGRLPGEQWIRKSFQGKSGEGTQELAQVKAMTKHDNNEYPSIYAWQCFLMILTICNVHFMTKRRKRKEKKIMKRKETQSDKRIESNTWEQMRWGGVIRRWILVWVLRQWFSPSCVLVHSLLWSGWWWTSRGAWGCMQWYQRWCCLCLLYRLSHRCYRQTRNHQVFLLWNQINTLSEYLITDGTLTTTDVKPELDKSYSETRPWSLLQRKSVNLRIIWDPENIIT